MAPTVLAVSVAVAVAVAGNIPDYCPSYRCGHKVDVRYPFWVDGDDNGTADGHCGYDPLRLYCHGDMPRLRLPSGEYAVMRINYSDRTLSLFDVSVSINASCPHVAGRNLTLPTGSPPPLALTGRNTNLTFLLDCDYPGLDPRHLVPCLQYGQNVSYLFRDTLIPYEVAERCQQVVGMPVLHPVEDAIPAIKAGFEISWSSPTVGGQCGGCEKSGGFCGQRLDMFACFSNNTSPPSTTSSGKNFGTTVTLVVLGIVFGLILVMGCALMFWTQYEEPQAEDSGRVTESQTGHSSVNETVRSMISGLTAR